LGKDLNIIHEEFGNIKTSPANPSEDNHLKVDINFISFDNIRKKMSYVDTKRVIVYKNSVENKGYALLNENRYDEPWDHIILDDFITQDCYESIIETIEDKYLEYPVFTDAGERYMMPFSINMDHQKVVNEIEEYKEKWMDFFNIPKQKTSVITEISVVGNPFKYIIHPDRPAKLISFIIYLTPLNLSDDIYESLGTKLYNNKKEHIKTVKAIPKRALIFSPLNRKSFHSWEHTNFKFKSIKRFSMVVCITNE